MGYLRDLCCPLLFLVYINDLAFTLRRHASPVFFTDDTSIIISAKNEQDLISNVKIVANATYKWCHDNYLKLNLQKTHFIQFWTNHHKKINFQLLVSETIIPIVDCTQFLGLILDNKLSWNAYSKELSIKLNKACYALRAIKSQI